MSNNAIAVWDLTIKKGTLHNEDVEKFFIEFCKAYTFQEELGKETGYAHYQARIRLNTKLRLNGLHDLCKANGIIAHMTPTVAANHGKQPFYCMKSDTRVAGPWRDAVNKEYIPRDWVVKKVRPWQIQCINTPKSNRHVNVIYDPKGGLGKSQIYKTACSMGKRAYTIMPTSGWNEIQQNLCSELMAKEDREPDLFIVNFNKAFPPKAMGPALNGVETILDGELKDGRYKTAKWRYEMSTVWIFTNQIIPKNLLSLDRWVEWKVVNDQLVKITNEN